MLSQKTYFFIFSSLFISNYCSDSTVRKFVPSLASAFRRLDHIDGISYAQQCEAKHRERQLLIAESEKRDLEALAEREQSFLKMLAESNKRDLEAQKIFAEKIKCASEDCDAVLKNVFENKVAFSEILLDSLNREIIADKNPSRLVEEINRRLDMLRKMGIYVRVEICPSLEYEGAVCSIMSDVGFIYRDYCCKKGIMQEKAWVKKRFFGVGSLEELLQRLDLLLVPNFALQLSNFKNE
ncbi:hypothetical protein HYV10_02270 [Candidatus Dependentiae bacterium]|nr:hypothetical protein [Candidatus Dependentiae bacterium]